MCAKTSTSSSKGTGTGTGKMVKMVVDGKEVQIEQGSTVLQAAQKLDIHIPTLCHNPELRPAGFCRICMVEIVKHGKKKLVTSCCYPVEEGLTVTTETPRIVQIRKLIVELLWPSWRQSAQKLGVKRSRFVTEHADCSLCGLCVRTCNEVEKKDAVYFHGRGVDRRVAFTPGMSECDSCRRCFSLCTGGFLITEHGKQTGDLFE